MPNPNIARRRLGTAFGTASDEARRHETTQNHKRKRDSEASHGTILQNIVGGEKHNRLLELLPCSGYSALQ
jgi:hypothetical protein